MVGGYKQDKRNHMYNLGDLKKEKKFVKILQHTRIDYKRARIKNPLFLIVIKIIHDKKNVTLYYYYNG